MKRFTLRVVMAGMLGLAAYTFSGAQPPARGPEGPRRGGGPGGGRGDFALLRDANLSDEQKAAIKAIRDAEREDGPPADARVRRELQAEVFAEAPDPQKIAALQQQVLQAQAARLARQIAVEQKLAQVLTAEQRAAIRERLAQAPSVRGRRGARPE
jgi:Spy/CpxP family protein refolding chaperone